MKGPRMWQRVEALKKELLQEQEDHDALISEVQEFRKWVKQYDIIAEQVLTKRLNKILGPYDRP